MVIYKTTNLLNSKFYVGKDARDRKTYLGSGTALKSAVKKYGKENFKKEILEECKTLEELSIREIYWIEKLNAINDGYNIAEGGTGGNTGGRPKGFKHPEEVKEKISKSRKGLTAWNKGTKGVMKTNKTSFKPGKDHVQYGTTHSDETKRKQGYQRSNRAVIHMETGIEYFSIAEAERRTGISKHTISRDCRRECKIDRFRYVKDKDKSYGKEKETGNLKGD